MSERCVRGARSIMEDYKGNELKSGEHEYTILFEETISQSFIVHAATLEEAKSKARSLFIFLRTIWSKTRSESIVYVA